MDCIGQKMELGLSIDDYLGFGLLNFGQGLVISFKFVFQDQSVFFLEIERFGYWRKSWFVFMGQQFILEFDLEIQFVGEVICVVDCQCVRFQESWKMGLDVFWGQVYIFSLVLGENSLFYEIFVGLIYLFYLGDGLVWVQLVRFWLVFICLFLIRFRFGLRVLNFFLVEILLWKELGFRRDLWVNLYGVVMCIFFYGVEGFEYLVSVCFGG